MIVITGFTEVDTSTLPNKDIIEYKVLDHTKQTIITMLANKPDCTTFYVHRDVSDNYKSDSYKEKLVLVTTLEDIKSHVTTGEIVQHLTQKDVVAVAEDVGNVEEVLAVVDTEEVQPHGDESAVNPQKVEDTHTEQEHPQEELEDLEDLEESIFDEIEGALDTQEEVQEVQDVGELPDTEEVLLDLNDTTIEELEEVPVKEPDNVHEPTLVESNTVEPPNVYTQTTTQQGYNNEELTKLKEEMQEKEEQHTREKLDLQAELATKEMTEKRLQDTVRELERQLLSVNSKLDNAVIMSNNRLKQQQTSFNEKIRNANEVIQDLSRKIVGNQVKEATKKCEIFSDYVVEPRAIVKVPLTDAEKIRIGVQNSRINIVSVKGSDSLVLLQDEVMSLIKVNKPCLIVDFTGDLYMLNKYGIRAQTSCLDIEKYPMKDVVMQMGNVHFIPTIAFNDVSLLTMNWDIIVNNLLVHAQGKPIIILLNDIDMFSTRFVVSRLGEGVADVSIVTKATPYNMTTIQVSQMYLPHIKKQVIVLGYTDAFREITKQLTAHYTVVPSYERLDWGKLGL